MAHAFAASPLKATTLALGLLIPAQALAQDICVTGDSLASSRIQDGDPSDGFAGSFERYIHTNTHNYNTFRITNLDTDTHLHITGPITLSGLNAAEFDITGPQATDLGPGASTIFTVGCAPAADGVRTAIVTIPNDDPDAGESNFTFAVATTGFTSPFTKPDLVVNAMPKVKGKPNTSGHCQVRQLITVGNNGNQAVDGVLIAVYASADEFFDDNDTLIFSTTMKGLPAKDPNKPTKWYPLNLNVDTGLRTGRLFIRATPDPANLGDSDYANNQVHQDFGATFYP
jgi:hypothetical protein